DPRFTAVVDKRFSNAVSEPQSVGTISLESYAPNKLVYKSSNAGAGTAVFSEIYYPSWRAYIDGEQVEIARANYVLRALNVPAGNHTIAFVFDPISLHRTETIANIANIILLLGLILSGAIGVKRLQKMKKTMK
ncbi:MAG: YfhO family protein, partial [Bacteroidales bacterium]|nr:YfhO family protein [Bacteroidales bacterium]